MQSPAELLQLGVVIILACALLTYLVYVKARSVGVGKARLVRGLIRVWLCVLGYVGAGLAIRVANGHPLLDVGRNYGAGQAPYGVTASGPSEPVKQALLAIGLGAMVTLALVAMRTVRTMMTGEVSVTRKPPSETDDTQS
jgi:hypothetical protein